MKKLTIILCSFILACCPMLTGCGEKDGKTRVRLYEVTHSIFYAPLYVAINQGFFEAEGLNVELTNAGGSDKVMTAVTSKAADIGLMGPEATVYNAC